MKAGGETLVALLHGPDQKGLVSRVAGWIYERGGNIEHADQHRDAEAGIFFQRVVWETDGEGPEAAALAFGEFAQSLDMQVRVARASDRPRAAILVSKAAHCFHDLLLRSEAGELPWEPVCAISNHTVLEGAAGHYGLPFHFVAVEAGNKEAAESEQLCILRDYGVELVVLARYMQVLSGDLLGNLGCPVINIHHSFLPAFAGARPYKQAYLRGVKLIGATAHYVTEELDEGPIIHQDVARVSHRYSVADLVRKGRDLEKLVLAQAVRWHLEHRVLVYDRKTVVFD